MPIADQEQRDAGHDVLLGQPVSLDNFIYCHALTSAIYLHLATAARDCTPLVYVRALRPALHPRRHLLKSDEFNSVER